MTQVLCPSLVGRQNELDRLGELLAAPTVAGSSVVVVSGEAGIGKTRLVREAASMAQQAGTRVLQGRAVQAAAPLAYRPLTEALQAGVDDIELQSIVSSPDVARLTAVLPQVASDAGLVQIPQLAVFDAVERLLVSLTGPTGLLVVLEDLHWADAETLSMVEYLADTLPGERVLCLCTVRTDAGGPAEAAIDDLVARRACTRIELARLNTDAVEQMTQLCLDVTDVPAALLETLTSRATGVPFLVEEMLSAYVDAGGANELSPEWRVSRRIADALPASYRAVVSERMERLPDRSREAVRAAAVLGRTFEWRLLAGPAGLEDQEVLDALRAGVRAHLIRATGEHFAGSFEFRHALAREAILADLLPTERATFAERLAHEVERAFPGVPGEWCERAADLFEQGGDRLGAVRLLQESARRSLMRSAFSSAESALLHARELCQDDWMVWMGVDDLLLDVHAAAGRTADVVEVGRRLVETYEHRYPGGNREGRHGWIHLRIARGVLPSGDRATVTHHLERARELAQAGDEGLGVAVTALDARLTLESGDVAGSRTLAIAAGEKARRLDLVDVECEALAVRADAELRSGDIEAAGASYASLAETAADPRLVVWRIRALLGLGVVDRSTTGSVDRLTDARDLAVPAGAVSLLAAIDLETARAHLERVDLERARAPLTVCLDACRRYGLGLLPEALAEAAMLHALAADASGVDAVAAEAQERFGEAPSVIASGRGVLALVQGKDEKSLKHMDEACATATNGPVHWWLGVRALLAVAVREDDGPYSQLRKTLPAADAATRAYVEYCDAITAGRAGKSRDASAAVARADGLLPEGWHYHHARRLVADAAVRDGWGEPVAWAGDALEFFEGAMLPRLADACRSTLRRAGVPLRRRGRGDSEVPGDLKKLQVTSREMDVLNLLADRLTNREIGERLFVSPRTVETHVVSLRRKTGLGTRAELAELARHHQREEPR